MSFGELFAELIEGGHRREDVLKMSFSQALLFWRMAQKMRRTRLQETALAVRVAFNAKPDEFRSFLRSLEVDNGSS